MKLPRRNFLHLAAGVAALPAVSRLARAQAYPARPVRIIIGFAAGGVVEIVARLIGQSLSERLGQPFIIESRPGAASNIATEAVVRAPPDGYTLLVVSSANAINATLYDKLNFVFLRDIAPIASIIRLPFVMVVNPSVPAKTVPEFIAYAKANPGKLTMASGGIGAATHLAGELFKDDQRRHSSCAISGLSSLAHRSARRAGAGDVRLRAFVGRVHRGRQAARAGSNERETLGGAA
jgi:tripartite-type tricarboxylate transporter receptor subunit TctC